MPLYVVIKRLLSSGDQGGQVWLQMGQLGPKLGKSVTFPDHISVYFGSPSYTENDLKKSAICPI